MIQPEMIVFEGLCQGSDYIFGIYMAFTPFRMSYAVHVSLSDSKTCTC